MQTARPAFELTGILGLTVIDLKGIQAALREDQLDGWLLYDFHGSNSIARAVVALDDSDKLTTRRWYYFIPTNGEPRALVHQIEQDSLAHLPGERQLYAGSEQLKKGLAELVGDCQRLAMEYSPSCAIPYVSKVDGGTLDAIRQLGVTVLSSGDLVQRFEATWDQEARISHQEASERLYRIKDRAFALIAERLQTGTPLNEFEVQRAMVNWFDEEGLVSDSAPVVAAQENSGNPHYLPTSTSSREIRLEEVILLDLWAKQNIAGAVFADITWVGYTGSTVPTEYASVFEVARNARDAAISLVENTTESGQELQGWEVDQAAREVVDKAGFGEHFVHRTGHSLGKTVHGNGVHMDNYETHDTRRLLPGTGFTIEPGIYFDRFGVRTEINMYVDKDTATVTGPRQEALVTLL